MRYNIVNYPVVNLERRYMFNRILHYFLQKYQNSDYIIRQKATVIFAICISSIAISSFFIVYTAVFESLMDPGVSLPLIFGLMIICLLIVILKKGHLVFVAHSFIITVLAMIWVTMFTEEGAILQRLDTVVLVIAILVITPIAVSHKKGVILLYFAANIILLFVFAFFTAGRFLIPMNDLIEYMVDTVIALVIAGIVSYLIFRINYNAIEMAVDSEEKIREQNEELQVVNEELRAALEDLAVANEAYESQNEELIDSQRALLGSQLQYRLLADNVTDVLWTMNMNLQYTYFSPSVEIKFGFTVAEALERSIEEWVTPASYRTIMDEYEKQMKLELDGADSNRTTRLEIENICKDGTTLWVELNMSWLRDESRKAVGLLGVSRDISQRKGAEDALEEEKERLAVTLRSIGDGVITINIEQNIVLMNRAAESLTGWLSDEARGLPMQTVFTLLDRDTRKEYPNPVTRVMNAGSNMEFESDILLVNRNGTERIISYNAAPVMDKGEHLYGTVLVIHDITEEKRLERELNKMQQLESLGVLAGGIAHDFNNILAAILGNISLAKLSTASEAERQKSIEDAERASLQARDLTGQLLTFAKGGAPLRESSSVRDIILDSVEFSLSGSDVKCECMFPDDLWQGFVDAVQVGQVVRNLVINAKQAMPDGGTIMVTGSNYTVEEGSPLPLFPGDYIEIMIKDTGTGIDKEYVDRIFDPYFSTKKEGHGLGLSVVFSILKNHGGHIVVESEEGQGTCFVFYLPASGSTIESVVPDKKVIASGAGKILFMDDEKTVSTVAGRMLEMLGYEVKLAIDGAEVLEEYKSSLEAGVPYDLIIMDITVPGGMGGKEAIVKLLELDPGVQAIISSGYSNDPVMANFGKYGFCGRIVKPYKVEELSEVIEKIIKSTKGKN